MIQSDGSHKKTVKINNVMYDVRVSSEEWSSIPYRTLNNHISHIIRQMKKGKHYTPKYGKITKTDTLHNICDICNKTYQTRSGLLRHIKKYHMKETNERTISTPTRIQHISSYFKKQSDGNFTRMIAINDVIYKLIVHKSVWESTNVSRHATHWIQQKKEGKECIFKYGTVEIYDTHSNETHKCTNCNKIYKTRYGLVRHINKYHNTEILNDKETNERTISTQTDVTYDEFSVLDVSEYEDVDPSASTGYVYCFSCESMPGIYKIGMTTCDVKERLAHANRSSTWLLPDNYKHILSKRVNNPYKKEQLIHKILDEYRVTHKREFFKVPLVKIKYVFALLTEVSADETTEE